MATPLFPRYTFKNFLWTCGIVVLLATVYAVAAHLNPWSGPLLRPAPGAYHADFAVDSSFDSDDSKSLSDKEYLEMKVEAAKKAGARITYLSRPGSGWLVFDGKIRKDLQ